MKNVSIRLKGFRGFRTGLGMDEVFIDFTSLPDGLIAIVGANGMGKTTLLDNLHPYRIMPYKLRESKEWSTGSFSYYDQCYGRDAMKEYVFEYNGKRYKSLILIDAERRKQEAYLFMETAQGTWVPYNDAVKDGKTGPYDAAVEELVGTPSLFFSSNFRSQDARKLSSYPRSEILAIVCESLNIEHIKEQGEKAAKVVSALESMIQDLERRKAPIMEMINKKSELESKILETRERIGMLENAILLLKESIATVEAQIRELELSNAAAALTRTRISELTDRSSILTEELGQLRTQLQAGETEHERGAGQIKEEVVAAKATLEQDIQGYETEKTRAQETAAADTASLTAKKSELTGLIARSNEIAEAVTRASVMEHEITADRVQLGTMQTAAQSLTASVTSLETSLKTTSGSIETEKNSYDADKTSIENDIQHETVRADADMNDIDRKSQELSAIMAKSAEITAAVEREQELTALLAVDTPELERLRAQANEIRIKLAGLASLENEIVAAQSKLTSLQEMTAGLVGLDCHENGSMVVNKTCKMLTLAVAAEKQIPDVEKEIGVLLGKQAEAEGLVSELTGITEVGTALAAKVKKNSEELADVRKVAAQAAQLTSASAQLAELTTQRESIKSRCTARVTELNRRLATLQTRHQERTAELTTTHAQLTSQLAEARETLSRNSSDCELLATSIRESEIDLEETRLIAALQPELAAAGKTLTELEDREKLIVGRLTQTLEDIERRQSDTVKRAAELQETLVSRRDQLDLKWNRDKEVILLKEKDISAEIDKLIEDARRLEATLSGNIDEEVSQLREIISSKVDLLRNEEASLKQANTECGILLAAIDDIDKKTVELVRFDEEIARTNEEMVNWKIIAKACSNDGIIPLELADAGPAIAQNTNNLLRACYGPRYSVRLETQAEKASGGLKEVFDITVFDSERNEVKSIRDMSGGEVTYIEDALARSFCSHNRKQAGKAYLTAYTDEKDGALDPAKKFDFLDIKRQAMAVGDHVQEFFITQSPELYEQADARIVLDAGSVNIVLR